MKLKQIFLLMAALLFTLPAMSQQAYMAINRVEEFDELGAPADMVGVLILSKSNDLVISVTNSTEKHQIERSAMDSQGYYAYRVLVPTSSTNQPKLEISHRGKVDHTSVVAKHIKGCYAAYEIVEVAKPIDIKDNSGSADAILDATLAALEFSSELPDLTISASPKLGAEITTGQKEGDLSIYVTSVVFPVATVKEAMEAFERTSAALAQLEATQSSDWTEQQWEQLDQAEKDAEAAAQLMREITTIGVSGTGTNHLTVDISDMGPRMKRRYGVLLLNRVEKEFVSATSGHLEDGARFFTQRNYSGAKAAFQAALAAADCPMELRPTIQTNIADADTCAKYNNLALGAIKALKAAREVSQEQAVIAGEAAIENLQVLLKYNDIPFYHTQIAKLKEFIKDQPLNVRFTISKWVNDESGFYEGGGMPHVEVWGYYGSGYPTKDTFKSQKKFERTVKRNPAEFRQLGVTDAEGAIEVAFERDDLPQGLIFRPSRLGDNVGTVYKEMTEVTSSATREHKMRQFRIKMYTKQ